MPVPATRLELGRVVEQLQGAYVAEGDLILLREVLEAQRPVLYPRLGAA